MEKFLLDQIFGKQIFIGYKKPKKHIFVIKERKNIQKLNKNPTNLSNSTKKIVIYKKNKSVMKIKQQKEQVNPNIYTHESKKKHKKKKNKVVISNLLDRLYVKKYESKQILEKQVKSAKIKQISKVFYNKLLTKNEKFLSVCETKEQYIQQNKLTPYQICFFYQNKEGYILDFMQQQKWHRITQKNQKHFADFLLENQDTQSSYQIIQNFQYYNHFQGNQNLTCKNLLYRNLRNYTIKNQKIQFFPQTFDFNLYDDQFQFRNKKFLHISLKLLKNHYRYFKNKQLNNVKALKKIIKLQIKNQKHQKVKFKLLYQNFPFKYEKFTQQFQQDFQINLIALSQIFNHWKTIYDQINDISDNHKFYDCLSYDKKQIQQLKNYSVQDQPYHELNQEQKLKISEDLEDWKTPNQALIYKICYYHVYFKKYLKNYQTECKKYWILKPVDKSKGCGIQIINNVQLIKQITKQKGRLIQQYISQPLLYNNFKFDMRVWVLISSVQPLVVLCSKQYNLEDIDDLSRHLTNYSINKNYFNNKQDSILSKIQFETWMQINHNVNTNEKIIPQIENIIQKSIESSKSKLMHRDKSFELLGYDFLLDQNFKIWLLEVNLSPACKNRCNYLKKITTEMTKSLFDIIQQKSEQQSQNQWLQVQIEESQKQDKVIIKNINFKIQGKTLDVKQEKKNMKNIQQQISAQKIQNYYRNYKKISLKQVNYQIYQINKNKYHE